MRPIARRTRSGWIALALLVVAAPVAAQGEPAPRPRAPLISPQSNFWQQIADPFAEEIEVALAKSAQNLAMATDPYAAYAGADYAEHRRRLLRDAYGMLRYARRLRPEHPRVLFQLGVVADALGRAGEARQHLERYLEVELDERVEVEAHRRLGRLHARAERWDQAVVHLRRGLAGLDDRSGVIINLAQVYMASGRMAEAIDLLAHSQPLYPNALVQLGLAVAYDRDEQLSQAYQALEGFLGMLGPQTAAAILAPLEQLELVPTVDRYYFRALAYEAAGHLSEARREWQHYAGIDDAPFRRRALQHVRDLDDLLEAEVKRPPAPAAPPPTHTPYGRPFP